MEPQVMTSLMLKALAHPIRRRIMSVMGAQDFARAADLAEQLGVPANTLSFHLRSLADAGLILEAPEHARDRRDRVWKLAHVAFQVGSPEEPIAPENELPLTGFLSQMALDQQRMVARILEWAPAYATGRDADVKGNLSTGTLRLTPGQAREVFREMQEVLERARELHGAGAPTGPGPGEGPGPGPAGGTEAAPDARVWAWDFTVMAAREDL